jgi:hypothetical protein
MNQGEFTSIFCARPQNFAWFLGAGASRTAGLPTATDIIWDLKRRYYCREENQDVTRQDIQSHAVRQRIQAFMDSRGFPALWTEGEYAAYFEKIFGADRERQRSYLSAILSEDRVTLSVGGRVLGGLMVAGLCRAVFTTNFDNVVEKAVAAVGRRSLAAFHLEGARAAVQALNNEEYPLYCKLHGDYRYDSLKNLPADLAAQNADLSACLVNAGNRFGFVVAGYSGRDASVMALFRSVLDSPNPFPHGLYWTGIKRAILHPAVETLLEAARARGVNAHHVAIETFDALLLRVWRNIEPKPPDIDAEIRKARQLPVAIPLPPKGGAKPLLRLNALPIVSLPKQCLSLTLRNSLDWDGLRQAEQRARGGLVLSKSDAIWCWGPRAVISQVFGDDLVGVSPAQVPADLEAAGQQHFKAFVETALCRALARGKPLRSHITRHGPYLIADSRPEARAPLKPLAAILAGPTCGTIANLLTPVTEEFPSPEQVAWSEAVLVSVEFKDGKAWLLLAPDIWIWPRRARHLAVNFMEKRRGGRFNNKHNALLDAWIQVILGAGERGFEVSVRPFDAGDEQENPSFTIGSRTAYSRRLTS